MVGLPLLVVGGCTALLVTYGNPGAGPGNREVSAQCEQWVRDALKAPASASFTGVQVAGGGGAWVVTGDVDAENSFGAEVRQSWTCNITLDGDLWRGSAALD